jgi:hypothetical protein
MDRLDERRAAEIEEDAIIVRAVEHLRARQRLVRDEQDAIEVARKRAEFHPHYHRFLIGGTGAAAGQTVAHIVPMIGALASPTARVIEQLKTGIGSGDGGLARLTDLTKLLDANAFFATAGMAVLARKGLLDEGEVPTDWLDRTKLGLGQGPCFHGLRARHNAGYVGLWSLDRDAFVARFAGSAAATVRTFGDAVCALVDGDPGDLAELGARVLHARAAATYHADCACFVAWQLEHPDALAWRDRPPVSAQGHLARTTAEQLDIAMSNTGTRGDAAAWLDDHDANLRFRKD